MKEHTIGRSRSSAPGVLKAHHPVGDHLRPDRQVAPAGERAQRRVGDLADTELQRGASGHEVGDALGDRLRMVVAGADSGGREVLLGLDCEVDEVFG